MLKFPRQLRCSLPEILGLVLGDFHDSLDVLMKEVLPCVACPRAVLKIGLHYFEHADARSNIIIKSGRLLNEFVEVRP